MKHLAVAVLLVLTACGASGPPLPPNTAAPEIPKPGVTMSGEASIGVARNGTK